MSTSMSTAYIVYLWLLPLFLFIVLPLLMLAGYAILMVIKDLFTSPEPQQEQVEQEQTEPWLQPTEA